MSRGVDVSDGVVRLWHDGRVAHRVISRACAPARAFYKSRRTNEPPHWPKDPPPLVSPLPPGLGCAVVLVPGLRPRGPLGVCLPRFNPVENLGVSTRETSPLHSCRPHCNHEEKLWLRCGQSCGHIFRPTAIRAVVHPSISFNGLHYVLQSQETWSDGRSPSTICDGFRIRCNDRVSPRFTRESCSGEDGRTRRQRRRGPSVQNWSAILQWRCGFWRRGWCRRCSGRISRMSSIR